MKKYISGLIIGVIFAVACAAGASGINDIILHEDKNKADVQDEHSYTEVFKQEGNGDKNYLYTVTSFKDRFGRSCTVVTGASETAISMTCERLSG